MVAKVDYRPLSPSHRAESIRVAQDEVLTKVWDRIVRAFGAHRYRSLHQVPTGPRPTATEIRDVLDDERNLEAISQVSKMVLSVKFLTDLPLELQKFRNLRILDLEHNHLASLNPIIKTLTKLEELDLSENRLTFFPAELVPLIGLKKLLLASNQLPEPPDLSGFPRLEEFSIAKNHMVISPEWILQVPRQIKRLDLSGNIIQYPYGDHQPFLDKLEALIKSHVLQLDENQLGVFYQHRPSADTRVSELDCPVGEPPPEPNSCCILY